MSIWFIGGGAMAEAMINGILDSKVLPPDKIGVSELVEARRSYLKAVSYTHLRAHET